MPCERRRLLLHDDIASNLLLPRRVPQGSSIPFPALQVTLDGMNLSMFD
jgi:hypothetical protein